MVECKLQQGELQTFVTNDGVFEKFNLQFQNVERLKAKSDNSPKQLLNNFVNVPSSLNRYLNVIIWY